jgi:hypothetical protein
MSFFADSKRLDGMVFPQVFQVKEISFGGHFPKVYSFGILAARILN